MSVLACCEQKPGAGSHCNAHLHALQEGSEEEPEAATPHPGVRALKKVASAGGSPEGRSSSMPVGASRRKMGGVIPGFSEAEVEVGSRHPCSAPDGGTSFYHI